MPVLLLSQDDRPCQDDIILTVPNHPDCQDDLGHLTAEFFILIIRGTGQYIFRQVTEFLHFWVPRGLHFERFWGLGGLIVSIFGAVKSM